MVPCLSRDSDHRLCRMTLGDQKSANTQSTPPARNLTACLGRSGAFIAAICITIQGIPGQQQQQQQYQQQQHQQQQPQQQKPRPVRAPAIDENRALASADYHSDCRTFRSTQNCLDSWQWSCASALVQGGCASLLESLLSPPFKTNNDAATCTLFRC